MAIIGVSLPLSFSFLDYFKLGLLNAFFRLGGLRQGDPLSPFLFIMAAESLHQILKASENVGLLKGFQVGTNKIISPFTIC